MKSLRPLCWSYKGVPYVSPRLQVRCSGCSKWAVVALPPALLTEQPDGTTHVCHPLLGGCNLGYAKGPT